MEEEAVVVVVAVVVEQQQQLHTTTRYVLQFPGLPRPTVIFINDFLREGFIDIYSAYIVSSSSSSNIIIAHHHHLPLEEGIPDACLITCTPEPFLKKRHLPGRGQRFR